MDCSVCVFCGLPGAGKTTLANHLKHLQGSTHKFIHVCYDSLLLKVDHAKSLDSISAWKAARSSIANNVSSILEFLGNESKVLCPIFDKGVSQSALEFLFQDIKTFDPTMKIVLLIDDNMQYRGMRNEYYRMCAKLEVGFSIVYFDIPLQVCLRNNKKRKNPIQEAILEKISNQMEIPGSNSKCKWEKFVVKLESSNLEASSGQLLRIIDESMEHPPSFPGPAIQEEIEKVRQINRKNFLHQADICIRRLVSMKIQDFKKSTSSDTTLSQFSKKLINVKKQTLFLLKIGYVDDEIFLKTDGNLDFDKIENSIHDLMNLIFQEIQ
ncbi:L-seryl-tRNA(Sec) kinase-like [Styela clava]